MKNKEKHYKSVEHEESAKYKKNLSENWRQKVVELGLDQIRGTIK